MSETFPVSVNVTDIQGMPALAFGQLDLTELSKKMAPRVQEEGEASFVTSNYYRPDTGEPSAGPHRYTIEVPKNDQARINVGTAALPIDRDGIMLDAKTHIRGWVTGKVTTYLGLGSTAAVGSNVNKQTEGYALHTTGSSMHVAEQGVVVSSRKSAVAIYSKTGTSIESFDEGVTIKAKTVVDVGTPGNFSIAVGIDKPTPNWPWWLGGLVLVGADLAGVGAATTPGTGWEGGGKTTQAVADGISSLGNWIGGYTDTGAQDYHDKILADNAEYITSRATLIAAALGVWTGFRSAFREAEKGTTGWALKREFGSAILAGVNALVAWHRVDKKEAESPNGQVKIAAKGGIKLDATGTIGITAANGVTVSGFKEVAIIGMSTNVKGFKDSGIWGGLGASVKAGVGDVTITSDFRGVSIGGEKDIKLTSEKQSILAKAKKDVEVGADEKVTISGKTAAYLGAGGAASTAVISAPDGVYLGEIERSSADALSGLPPDDGHYIAVTRGTDVTVAATKASTVVMKDTGVTVKSKSIDLDATGGNATVTAKNKLLLG